MVAYGGIYFGSSSTNDVPEKVLLHGAGYTTSRAITVSISKVEAITRLLLVLGRVHVRRMRAWCSGRTQ